MVSERLPCAKQLIDDIDALDTITCLRCGKGPCALDREHSERSAEIIARAFHEAYERLAPTFSYETRNASRKPWADVPSNNKELMIAVAQELMDRGIIESGRF